MVKFNYKNVGKEIGWNFGNMKYVLEQDCPYFYYHKVVEHITPNTIMLDIGCGSGEKSTKYYGLANKIVMLDSEPEMLNKAKNNVEKFYNTLAQNKFDFVNCDADKTLPFEDETFDLVVSRHCGANMKEVFRVLKKGGVFISEDIDDNDCIELKEYFKRGQNYEKIHSKQEHSYKERLFMDCLDAGVEKIELLNFDQREYYPNMDELRFLLNHTPILGGFDESDLDTLSKYCKDYSTDKGILLKRRLFSFEIKK